MRVIVCGPKRSMRIYEANDWKIEEGGGLHVLKNGDVVATHSAGAWETVRITGAIV